MLRFVSILCPPLGYGMTYAARGTWGKPHRVRAAVCQSCSGPGRPRCQRGLPSPLWVVSLSFYILENLIDQLINTIVPVVKAQNPRINICRTNQQFAAYQARGKRVLGVPDKAP